MMSLHRHTARKLSRGAQFISLLALALLAGVTITPRGEVKAPAVELPPAPAARNATQRADDTDLEQLPPPDWTTLSAGLDASRTPMVNPPSGIVAHSGDSTSTPDREGDPDRSNPDEPRPKPAPPGWQYLGYAEFSDGRLSALVTINSTQRFVQAGMQFDAYLISRITTTRLLLERDHQRFEVLRSLPAPFDASTAMGATSPLPGGISSQARNAQLEQQRIQLEAERTRRLQEARQNGTGVDPGGTQQR